MATHAAEHAQPDCICPMELTGAQTDQLNDRGIVRLPDCLPTELVDAARSRLLSIMATQNWWTGSGWDFADLRSADGEPAAIRHKLASQVTKRAKGLRELQALGNWLAPMIQRLLGVDEIKFLSERPALLVTLPEQGEWTIPNKIWHLDMPRLASGRRPGLQIFTFLGDVEPGGGGTLVLAGSHHLLNDEGFIRSSSIKRRLIHRHSYFRELLARSATNDEVRQRFFEPTKVDGAELQVVELTGAPGDVYITDLRLLHTLAPNVLAKPRLMLTQRFLTTQAWREISSAFATRQQP